MNSAVAPSGARTSTSAPLHGRRHQQRVALVRRVHQRRPAAPVAPVHLRAIVEYRRESVEDPGLRGLMQSFRGALPARGTVRRQGRAP